MVNIDYKSLLKKLNPYCIRCLHTASGNCVSRGNYEVSTEHMLLELIGDPASDIQIIIRHFEIDPARVAKRLEQAVERARVGNPDKPVMSPVLIEWFQEAWLLSSVDLGLANIRSGALLAALLSNPSRFGYGSSLIDSGITLLDELKAIPPEQLRRSLVDIVANSNEATVPIGAGAAASAAVAREPREETALGRFTEDLTANARDGKIDPVFCRDREIRQMVDILFRRRKNNPIVVGEAGVGKTAVVEGLALKIVQGDVPELLRHVEILRLELGSLQAGAGVKGEFENRLKAVIDEVKASAKPIILFIDEAHTLIGAGGTAGMSDAANLLKPALARGELRTIAATTWSEYKKYFEKDPALARRFQLVKLEEPSIEDTVTIIRGLTGQYEVTHGVYVRDDAVEAAARLSARYISGRLLPDKAVDVLDTACARVKISVSAKPSMIDGKEHHIRTVERELGAIQRDLATGASQNTSRITELEAQIAIHSEDLPAQIERWRREQEAVGRVLALRQQLSQTRNLSLVPVSGGETTSRDAGDTTSNVSPNVVASLKKDLTAAMTALHSIQGNNPLLNYEVSPSVVANVISDWTGIPVGSMVQDEARAALTFRGEIGKRIKGQGYALDRIDEGLRTAKAGLQNPGAPIAVFLFVGPSGVGKTETGLAIADLLFGGERFMITINMSEFQERHTVSRLIGSPPGYVGYGEGGRLTEAARQRPYSVVLLDEVEKADLEIMNLFYQVFDKGTLADGEGRQIDFKNTVMVLTSNLGAHVIADMCNGAEAPPAERIIEGVRPILSHHFKPALLARMQIVPFLPLAGDALRDIAELKLARIAERLRSSHRIRLTYEESLIAQIIERCTEIETGARNIDHILNRSLLPAISTRVLSLMSEGKMPEQLHAAMDSHGELAISVCDGDGRPESDVPRMADIWCGSPSRK